MKPPTRPAAAVILLAAVLVSAPASAQEAAPPLGTYPVAPCRLYDSRSHGTALHDNETTYRFVAGRCGIPFEATALMLTLTAVDPTGSGHLVVYSYTDPLPHVSSLSFNGGLTSSTMVLTKISIAHNDPGQAFRIFARVAGGGRVDWIVDVTACLRAN